MTDSQLQSELIGHYQWFHRHPELSYQEFATTAHLRQILEAAGISILDTPRLTTGLVAVINGTAPAEQHAPAASPTPLTTSPTSTVAIRGDIDGLPLTEDTGLPFASENTGVMHGCGHDFNLTSALGAALILHRKAHGFSGTVKVLFQPAEEVAADENTPTGSVHVLDSGVLDDVATIFGVHDTPALPAGAFGISAGPVSGAVSKFQIHVRGQGSHAAHPDAGRSPIRAAAHLIQAIESVPGLDVDPATPRAVTVTHVEAGSTWNVIPDKAFLEGTVRTLGDHARDSIHARIAALAEGFATAYELEIELRWEDGSPSVENDPRLAAAAQQTAETLGLRALPSVPSLSGEDFSYYQRKIPGLFVHAGVGAESGALHGPHFAPNVTGLADTATLLAALATDALRRLAG